MRKKMNRFLCCIMTLAAFAFALASCSNEETLVTPNIPVEKGKLSFVIPLGGKRSTTYAPVPGKDDTEYEIKDLRIYWFKDSDSKLFRVFTYPGGDITLSNESVSQATPSTIATIMVGQDNDPSKFYIVANVGSNSSVTSATLDAVHEGTTTRTEFEALLADDMAVDPANPNGDVVALATPIPMSIRNDGSTAGGFITVAQPASAGLIADNVHLKRRVARFDIINTAAYSNFRITNVVISRAQKTGYLHDKPFTGSEPWATNTGNLVVDGTSFNGTYTFTDSDADGVDDRFVIPGGSALADSATVTKGAFYLYPTTIDPDDATTTEITIEGLYYDAHPRLYKLNLTAPVNIEANKVYKIKILKSIEQHNQVMLYVDDWDDEAEFPVINQGNEITSWGTFSFGSQVLDLTQPNLEFEYTSSPSDPVKITIVSEGLNKSSGATNNHVTRISITKKDGEVVDRDYVASDLTSTTAATVSSNTIATYGAHYVTTHTITLPPTDAPIKTTLHVINAANPQQAKTVTLYSNNYGKTGFKPAPIGNLLWARVNVGASVLWSYADIIAGGDFLNSTGNSDSRKDGPPICGNYYQWGRNLAFSSLGTLKSIVGPSSWADAVKNDTSFIKGTATNSDWLTAADKNDALWSGENKQGPCPPGWYVPSNQDFIDLAALGNRTVGGAYSIFITTAAPKDTLYFPYGGFRHGVNTDINYYNHATDNTKERSFVWTSTVSATGVPYRMCHGGSDTSKTPVVSEGKTYAMPVRCVRDIPAVPQPDPED